MRSRWGMSIPEILFGLCVLGIAALVHGPAGDLLAAARESGGTLLAILAGTLWLASGAVLFAGVLSVVWALRALWRSRRP